MATRFSFIFIFFLCFLVAPFESYAQFNYHQQPLKQVIVDIEKKTSYRFLYRESLIADVKISFEVNRDKLFPALAHEIKSSGLVLEVDSTRKQAVIFQLKNDSNANARVQISGQVVDAQTGERLPFANVVWYEEGQVRGVGANSAGAFNINRSFEQDSVTLTAKYIGFASTTLELDMRSNESFRDITFRLRPKPIAGKAIIVEAPLYYSDVNSKLNGLVQMGMFSPLGASNVIRALQVLPSVSTQPAIADGINIRGSSGSGFKLLLDGMSIYNTSHLFGLLDSFNSDVLQHSGFYYGISPARLTAAPGGTLKLTTETGSLNHFKLTTGLSNTAYKATLEGPLANGRGSWLISGRHSYINVINWLNTDGLIRMGLGVERPSSLDEETVTVDERLVQPSDFDAIFYDLHGKFYLESASGNRFIFSGYAGGDRIRQSADRYYRENKRFIQKPVTTSNKWNNLSASVAYQAFIPNSGFSQTLLGISNYSTSFYKEDFQYRKFNLNTNEREIHILPLKNESTLYEIKLKQVFDIDAARMSWSFGASYRYFMNEYEERSFYHASFKQQNNAHLIDLFAQADFTQYDPVTLNLGVRLHYFSNGNMLRFSPRIKLTLFKGHTVSWSAGYSRSYQFLNEISLNDVIRADFWLLASEDKPPLSVNYFTSGIYFNLSESVYAQVEAYHKDFDNYRIHELSVKSVAKTFRPSPVYFKNDAIAKGIEALLSVKFASLTLTQAYTLSSMKIENPLQGRTGNDILNETDFINPQWDHTHQYTVMVAYPIIKNFTVYATWLYASGAPNDLAYIIPEEPQRLDETYRFDLSFNYIQPFNDAKLSVSVSFYNLLNRNNPWYREYMLVFRETKPRLRAVPVTIYDLGFQPSFKILVEF